MTTYPLLFGFRDLVAGRGFFAEIAVDGRAILVEEEDASFWMYGVNPGAIAAGGDCTGAARSEFRSLYRSVLFDFAGVAEDFAELKQLVADFFNQTNEDNEARWAAAVKQVRAGLYR